MKKLVIVVGSVLMALVLVAGGMMIYAHMKPLPPADRSENVNVMLTRADDWQRIIDRPVVPEADIALVDGSTATIPITAELLRQFYGYTDDQINQTNLVYHSTTHNAYENLVDQRDKAWGLTKSEMKGSGLSAEEFHPVSIILVTPPSAEERQYALDRGIGLGINPVAKDAFVFITHKDNPVTSLTVDQVQGIYSGQITNWSQVGGENRAIVAYQREPNSGSQTAMEEMVMAGKAMQEPIQTKVVWGMGSLVDAVAEYDNGPASIGYTYNYYINNLYKNDNIKVIPIDGVAPTSQAIADATYPFTTSYDVIIREDEPADSPARVLRDFLLTPEGQDLVAMAGYNKAVN